MHKSLCTVIVLAAMFSISCTVLPHKPPLAQESIPERPTVPKPPKVPETPEYIMGKGLVPPEVLGHFLLEAHPEASRQEVMILARIYTEEAAIEAVNHDIAFVQMCLETGFLRFGGLVNADMHNYCGLGSIGPGQEGEHFPDARTGIRAHIQHLKAYASDEALVQELVDPRYRFVKYGTAPSIHDLGGRWASDKSYGSKLQDLLQRLYQYAFGS